VSRTSPSQACPKGKFGKKIQEKTAYHRNLNFRVGNKTGHTGIKGEGGSRSGEKKRPEAEGSGGLGRKKG